MPRLCTSSCPCSWWMQERKPTLWDLPSGWLETVVINEQHLAELSPPALYHHSVLHLPSVLNPTWSSAAALSWVIRDGSVTCICPVLGVEAQYWGPTTAVPKSTMWGKTELVQNLQKELPLNSSSCAQEFRPKLVSACVMPWDSSCLKTANSVYAVVQANLH